MPKTSLNKTINFLTPILEPEDIWVKIYNWVTIVGKYLLVLVCGVVLAVFFARFFLDKRNNDLSTQTNDKIEGLLSVKEKRQEEIRFRGYMNLTSDIAQLSQGQLINSTKVAAVLDSIPQSFILHSISFDADRISLTMSSDKFEDIGKYSSSLNSNPQYSDVNVAVSKTSGSDSTIDFSVSFTLVGT